MQKNLGNLLAEVVRRKFELGLVKNEPKTEVSLKIYQN